MELKLKNNSNLKLSPYTELEYIESTGTQYIDTGIKADNNNQTFKIGVSFLSNDQYTGSSETDRMQATAGIFRNSSNALAINWGTWSRNGFVLQSNYPLETLAEIEIKAGNVVKLNGNNTTITAQNVSFTSGRTANFILNGISEAVSGSITCSSVRTHYFIVENDGVEILHLIPSKDSNNIVCLYDKVSETFFYNQGTGAFIAGPVVTGGDKAMHPALLKASTLYHENCPNINGLQLLNNIINTQEAAEDVVLNRIRVDIGNVSGSLSKLLQYAGMAGFNDNYEPQTKPRLVGTWTVNDWYTQEQLVNASTYFDGLTVQGDPNYLIDFNNMAVQTLDNTQPNYNPGAAICMQGAGLGVTLDEPPISGQTGRWFITKTEVAAIATFNCFRNKQTVVDVNGIITSDTSITYNFDAFPEFKYFTGITGLGNGSAGDLNAFGKTAKDYIELPNTIVNFGYYTFYNNNRRIVITYNGQNQNPAISFHRFHVGDNYVTAIFKTDRIYSLSNGDWLYKAYIGFGNSKYEDVALLELYLNDSSWINYRNKLDTYYNYAAPQITYNNGIISMSTIRTSDVYYTTDGSVPSKNSTKYTQSFAWDGTGCIKAMAVETIDNIDYITYSDDFYAQTVANPTITYDTTNQTVAISAEQDATIYYTLDGTHPTLESSTYSGPIDVSELGDIVKVRCFVRVSGKNDSEVVGKICVIDDILWGTDADTSSFAVQCIDSTKPNYNPAMCIVMQPYYGTGYKSEDQNYGNYFLLKTDAANINPIAYFEGKPSVVDNNKIVSNQQQTYNQTLLNFKFFRVTSIDDWMLERTNFSCPMILPDCLVSLGQSFYNSNFDYIHILATNPPTGHITTYTFSFNYKIYVGDGSSAAHDDAILADYLADTNWATYSSRLDTWYNYLHPNT